MSKRILDLKPDIEYPITLAKIDNQYTSLQEEVPEWGSIELLSIKNSEARRTYERTLVFLLDYISKKNDVTIKIEHSYGDVLYGKFLKGTLDINYIKKELKKLVSKNKNIEKMTVPKLEALHLLKEREDDIKILKKISRTHIPVYRMDDFAAYFAGPLLPSTGFLKVFDIISLKDEFLVILPDKDDPDFLGDIEPRRKLFKIYKEAEKESEILKMWDIARLNDIILSGEISDLIKLSETLHVEKITKICARIIKNKNNFRILFIAGPSSSGKTTFAKRLGIHLRANGINPIYLYLDNYFREREETPRTKDGIPLFDILEALDTELFKNHLKALLEGKDVERIAFNFKNGSREKTGKVIKMEDNDILIIEGLHLFNPALVDEFEEIAFFIYVSAITQLNINRINRIPTRDVRLLRRIFRDTIYRGHSPTETLKLWEYVKKGEEKYIFPYQERADVMFNSSLVYELAVLKKFVETPLRSVDPSSPFYCEALRLLNFIEHFLEITEDEIPPTSILREFIGGSTFYY